MQLSLSQTPKSISSANYLLRQYGGAAAAYSLQRLDTSTGNVVRARRSTDDAESNFTAEEVSGGSLREFALNNDADLIRFANQATAADKRMYFDGVNDYVDFGLGDPLGFNGAGKITLAFKFAVGALPASDEYLFGGSINGGSTGTNVRLNASGTIRVQARSVSTDVLTSATSTSTINVGDLNQIEIYIDYANDEIGININSGGYETTAATFANSTYTYGSSAVQTMLGGFGLLGSYGKGVIYDFEVYKNDVISSSYNGYGNTDADWEDQVGSNDGTVSGSPALFSGQGFDAYVTTLYDQSGNGRDATQATAASQPQIVADGVVVTDANGKPSILFDGSNDGLSATWGILTGSAARTFFAVFGESTDGIDNDDMVSYGSATALGLSSIGYTTGPVFRCTTGNDQASTADAGNIAVVTHTFDGTSNLDNAKLYVNGTKNPAAAVAGATENTASTNLFIGQRSNNTAYADGKCSEIVIYGSDKSSDRAAIEANIASRYGIVI